jgi:hypothetical protein
MSYDDVQHGPLKCLFNPDMKMVRYFCAQACLLCNDSVENRVFVSQSLYFIKISIVQGTGLVMYAEIVMRDLPRFSSVSWARAI